MKRTALPLAAILLLGAGLLMAASDVAGTWDLVSAVDGGDEMSWKLVIKEDNGKLTGILSGEPGDFTLEDIKVDGDTLTFKVSIDYQTYTTESKIAGSKLNGTFKSSGSNGTLKGTKEG
ncbi:MAG: hypothetical protein ACM336_14175 [Acidobacteriota bacterium]